MSAVKMPNADDIRIVAVNAHHDSGEIEVVLELTEAGKAVDLFQNQVSLVSCWIDKIDVMKKIIKFKSEIS